jgi:hypothetical protein
LSISFRKSAFLKLNHSKCKPILEAILNLKIKKITIPISIEKIIKEEIPNKFKTIKTQDEMPIPIGKERLTRNRKLIVFVSLKIKRQEKNPIKSEINNIEKKNII